MVFVVTLPGGLSFAKYELKIQTADELVEYMKHGRVELSLHADRFVIDSVSGNYDWQFSFGIARGAGVALPAVIEQKLRTEQLGVGILLLAAMAIVNQSFLNSEFAKVGKALRK